MNPDLVDIALTPDGDWAVENGDFVLTQGWDVIRDDNRIRMLTDTLTFRPYPWLGADLADFLGKPNTEATGVALQSRLLQALTLDANLLASQLEILLVPIGNTIVIHVVAGDGKLVDTYILDLEKGVRQAVDEA